MACCYLLGAGADPDPFVGRYAKSKGGPPLCHEVICEMCQQGQAVHSGTLRFLCIPTSVACGLDVAWFTHAPQRDTRAGCWPRDDDLLVEVRCGQDRVVVVE